MKHALLFFFIPFLALAQETADLLCLLTNAAALHDTAYLDARQKIVNLGTNALPKIALLAMNMDADWRTRLVARICYERIARSADIKELRNQDWKIYPPYQSGSKETRSILGPSTYIGGFVTAKCVEYGLWYYYVELIWKETKEFPETTVSTKFNSKWPWWCFQSVMHSQEAWYRSRVLADYFESAIPGDNCSIDIYKALLTQHDPDFVPILIRRYDEFKKSVPGPDLTSDSWVPKRLPGKIDTILSFSDSRHVALIEKFLAEHSALASLTNKVSEVRARPAATAKPEPAFRLGTNLVVVVP